MKNTIYLFFTSLFLLLINSSWANSVHSNIIKPQIKLDSFQVSQVKADSDSTITDKPKIKSKHDIMAKTSGILGIIAMASILITIGFSFGTIGVFSVGLISIIALILGILSVKKVKSKKWARLGIILGSIGTLLLILWIGLIYYVIFVVY